MKKVNPCPKCGNDGPIYDTETYHVPADIEHGLKRKVITNGFIECINCDFYIKSNTEENAIKAWNNFNGDDKW